MCERETSAESCFIFNEREGHISRSGVCVRGTQRRESSASHIHTQVTAAGLPVQVANGSIKLTRRHTLPAVLDGGVERPPPYVTSFDSFRLRPSGVEGAKTLTTPTTAAAGGTRRVSEVAPGSGASASNVNPTRLVV
jgi:hypothetical protein